MNEDLLNAIKESELFLWEEVGTKECRLASALEFLEVVSRNNLINNVKVRRFTVDFVPHTQVYVPLDGGYLHSVVL